MCVSQTRYLGGGKGRTLYSTKRDWETGGKGGESGAGRKREQDPIGGNLTRSSCSGRAEPCGKGGGLG